MVSSFTTALQFMELLKLAARDAIGNENKEERKLVMCKLSNLLSGACKACILFDENLEWTWYNWLLLQQVYLHQSLEWASSLSALGDAYMSKGEYDKAIECYQKYQEIYFKRLS